MQTSKILTKVLFITSLVLFINVNSIYAHCDGINGPVVKAAKKSLETKNINYVLIWVSKEDENTVREFFQKVENVRDLSKQAKELADMYYFETIVRLHRKSEGEPYTGLKFSNEGVNPVIFVADEALEKGDINILSNFYNYKDDIALNELKSKFHTVVKSINYNINDVKAGRDFVRHYIDYIHTAVKLTGKGEDHKPESQKSGNHIEHD